MDKLYLVHGNTWYDGYGYCENLYGVFTDRKTAEKVKTEVTEKLYEKEMHNINTHVESISDIEIDILKQLTRIANALDRIAKRLPEECDTAEYAKENPDWTEKIEKMASGYYAQVIRCKDCKCFIPLEDMKKCPEYKDYPFEAAEKVHADGICTNTDKWVYIHDFCSEAKNSQ